MTVSATYRLIKDTILATDPCPDGPVGACPSCLAHAIEEALEVGAAKERHPAGRQLDIATCEHVWPGELGSDADCLRCGLAYGEWSL